VEEEIAKLKTGGGDKKVEWWGEDSLYGLCIRA